MRSALLIALTLLSYLQNSRQYHFYIKPDDSTTSQNTCPADICYTLQDVISNRSHFFKSNTTLELLSGMYDITENIGQLVIENVSHFRLIGAIAMSGEPETVIICHQNATLGITFVNTSEVEVSGIRLTNCSAELTTNITIDKTDLLKFVTNIDHNFKTWFSSFSGSCKEWQNFPCHTSIAAIDNKNLSFAHISVEYSKGVGILIFRYASLSISNSQMSHNRVNCLVYISKDYTVTTTILSNLTISHGQELSSSNLVSGMNVILRSVALGKISDYLQVTNVTFKENRGDFYLTLYRGTECKKRTTVNVVVKNSTFISITGNPGLSLDYIIIDGIPLRLRVNRRVYKLWPECKMINEGQSYVLLDIENAYFKGGCIVTRNLQNWYNEPYLYIVINNTKIVQSKCYSALVFDKTVIYYPRYFQPVSWMFNGTQYVTSPVDKTEQRNILIQDITISDSSAGGILLKGSTDTHLRIHFIGSTVFKGTRGSFIATHANVAFRGNTVISNNHAGYRESVFIITNLSTVTFSGRTTLTNNSGAKSALLIANSSAVTFNSHTIFTNNSGTVGGAISSYGAFLTFGGIAKFIGNSAAINGGGISLKKGSTIEIKSITNLSFHNNKAGYYGGGIFVGEIGLWKSKTAYIECFLRVNPNSNVEFQDNTAEVAGRDLYGGWIDLCYYENTRYYKRQSPSQFLTFKANDSDDRLKTDISSSPSRICMCNNSGWYSKTTQAFMEAFPGETIKIEVVAVGQRFGVVPATVKAEFKNTDTNIIDDLEKLQITGNKCTILKYTIKSRNKFETLSLAVERQYVPEPYPRNRSKLQELQQLEITISLKECPLGFKFDSNRNICACHPFIERWGVKCNITSQKILRKASQWISTTLSQAVVINHHCPYDYCKSSDLSFNLSIPDEQCASNRSGILCGACQPGLSHVLGTSMCKKCSNTWLLLVIPFVLTGAVLVAGLMFLNLTVSTGTINGLIFYANIVRANTAIFFPGEKANTFLSWFIAWLNLDIGIETCFYDGLDAYAKTWLQFAFPLYIWLLAGIIIVSCHYFTTAAKIFGSNGVNVLATLFLLSYSKLLRVTITIFQPIHLTSDDPDYNRPVWQYDGNVEYLHSRHVPLFIVAMSLSILLFTLYTLTLFGIQWLKKMSHLRVLFWVERLKPFFDAYTGVYRDQYCYWTGTLLLVRVGLFSIFSANTTANPSVNLLEIMIAMLCLLTYVAAFTKGVYKLWTLNLLEIFFHFNLASLSAAALYLLYNEKSPYLASQISVSLAVLATIGIVSYHSVIKVSRSKTWLKLYDIVSTRLTGRKRSNHHNRTGDDCSSGLACSSGSLQSPLTTTEVDLKELLITANSDDSK